MKKFWILVCMLLLPHVASARFENALVTDRPDVAESSETVGKHRFQWETSFQVGHDTNAGVTTNTYSFPTLLRFGIIDIFEFRLEGEMLALQTMTGAPTEKGFTDLAIGFKVHFFDQKDFIPSVGFLAHVNIPTGHSAFTARVAEPIFKFLVDWDIPLDFSLGTNWGIDIPVRDDLGDKFARFLYATALGHPMPFLSDRFNFFIEFDGAIPIQSNKSDQHFFDTGLTFLLNDDMQLDTLVQFGLNNTSDDVITALGFSWRFL